MTSITLDNLHIRYPRQPHPVLDGLALAVQSGELLALLGPSGSGKSTILKLIAGIERPDTGDICFDGQSILSIPANRRNAVLMFQKAYLFPFMSIEENISFGLKVQGAACATIRAAVRRMLELVELPGIERKFPAQLSGGEQQRVALARALVTRPRVLMLDEPLSSLDTNVRATLQEAIRRIQRELGLTTILVTHDLSEAMVLADRVALLLDGRIEACAAPRVLFQRPPTRNAARFVGVSTFLEGTVEQCHLQSTLGRLSLSHNTAGPSRPATFAIRPEHLRLLNGAADEASNALPGTITDMIYRGEATEYQVRIADQQVRVRQFSADTDHAPGTVVWVQFPPEHLFEVEGA
ncbi:MAG: ABC transporter ATP-binding protein [Chloroflexaceae bacterium]|nr:ABC transporter ATP-binding protein [Chloroflexaceae bacterium]